MMGRMIHGARHDALALASMLPTLFAASACGGLVAADVERRDVRDDDAQPDSAPDAVADDGGARATVVQIALGGFHTCARLSDGTIKCWGDNEYGQLGDGTTTNRLMPTAVPGRLRFSYIALGDGHTCAGDQCWGLNKSGQLGDGTTTDHPAPADVKYIGGGSLDIALGASHTCVARGDGLTAFSDGSVWCWGSNLYGQLGDGTTTSRFAASGLQVRELSLGTDHSCGRRGSGSVTCWGRNQSGQLGDGTTFDRTEPKDVPGLPRVAQIALGAAHTCAIRGFSAEFHASENTVACWGDNFHGKLGDGTEIDRWTPTVVPELSRVAEIALGAGHTCARLTDGTVMCWGDNQYGQLGDGTTTYHITPTMVPGLSGVAEITLGGDHTCARLTDGAIECWGDNRHGELGDGTTTNRSTPTLVKW